MALFGLALSLPIAPAVFFERARTVLNQLDNFSRRTQRLTGAALVILGVWSIWFGLFVDVPST